MARAAVSRGVEKVVGYPPLSETGERQHREFHTRRYWTPTTSRTYW
jgi:hypothetical protein